MYQESVGRSARGMAALAVAVAAAIHIIGLSPDSVQAQGAANPTCSRASELPAYCGWPSTVTILQPMSPASASCEKDDLCSKKVVVTHKRMPDGTKYCEASFDYNKLIRKHDSNREDSVTWELFAPKHPKAVFLTNENGEFGGGIRLFKPDGATRDAGAVWKSVKNEERVQVIAVRKGVAASAAMCHYPRVRVVDHGVMCCPVDPIIINDP